MGRDNVSDIRRALMGGPPPGISTVSAAPRDRFGNPIRMGSHVIYDPEVPMVFQVVNTKAILDPRAPQGLVEVEIVCNAKIAMPGNAPNLRWLAIGVTDGPAPPADPPAGVDTPPPPADPPLITEA